MHAFVIALDLAAMLQSVADFWISAVLMFLPPLQARAKCWCGKSKNVSGRARCSNACFEHALAVSCLPTYAGLTPLFAGLQKPWCDNSHAKKALNR